METPFDSVQKTLSYRSVTYETKAKSLRKRKQLGKNKLVETEKDAEVPDHLDLESSLKNNILEEKNIFEKKHTLPSSNSISNERQQANAKTPSEIFVYEGSLFSHFARGRFSDVVYSRIFESLKIMYSSRRKDNAFCKPAVLDLCEENTICRLSEIMQQRYHEALFEKDDVPCRKIIICRSEIASNVLKIMRVEGNCEHHGKPVVGYRDILSTIVISRTLKRLQMESNLCTSGFEKLHYCWSVYGSCTSQVTKTEDGHRKDQGDVESITDMIYIILEEESVERTLENFNFNTAYQAIALFKQVVYALAVAEENCEFEHRNLIRENIGIRLTDSKTFCYTLHSHHYDVPTAGLEVVIMDYNCSRMTYGHWSSQVVVYRNLDNFVNQVSKEVDGRNDVYSKMKNHVGTDWEYFLPYTNVLWLEYLLDILLGIDYLCPEYSENLRSLCYLQYIRNVIRSCESASELVISSDIFSNFP